MKNVPPLFEVMQSANTDSLLTNRQLFARVSGLAIFIIVGLSIFTS
jgi:hypothetical protein